MWKAMESWLSSRVWRPAAAGLMIVLIAVVDWRVELDAAFGFLYVFPLMLVGTVLPRWQISLVAMLCTGLADAFDPYPFTAAISIPRDILVFTSLAGTGLFAHAVTRSRYLAREAEEQSQFLVQTSPAAILTMAEDGRILVANAAAHQLFHALPDALPGQDIAVFLPALGHLRSRTTHAKAMHSELECRGHRATGEGFLAGVFFSMYHTALGRRVAAVVIDVSDALRERETAGLDQLLAGSRILVGAVFHEVGNLSSALAINYETLLRSGQLAGNKNLEAIGALIATLRQACWAELKDSAKDSDASAVDLVELVADLRLVLDAFCEESGIEVRWNIPANLPRVWADRHRLLQVLLNLMRNSERAMADSAVRRIDLTAQGDDAAVRIRVTDSGPGLKSTEHLFEPFQQGAESTGIGLYLSRALLRSFGGDLRHDGGGPGCSFVIELTTASLHSEQIGSMNAHETHSVVTG
jgi:signal transduction histidine kinase